MIDCIEYIGKEIIMLSLLLLIILFVIYSQLVGQMAYFYFPEILGKIKYKWPIGFFIILGLIQLVSFSLQAMHVSMQVVSICYSIIFLILTLIVIKYLYRLYCDKRLKIFKFKKADVIDYLLIALFIGFNFIICFSTNSFNDTNADQSFYITLVENNLGIDEINTILPLSGQIGQLDAYYNFQSFYLLLTYLSTIFQLEAVLVMAWLVPFLLWLTVAFTFLNLIHYVNHQQSSLKTMSLFFILWSSVSLFDYFVRYNVYGNNIRLFVFSYLMIAYVEYFKNSKTKTLVLCAILWLSAISLQSTTLFLGSMLMVAIGVYEIFFNKKGVILPLVFSATPLLIYTAFFLGQRANMRVGLFIGGVFLLFSALASYKKTRNMIQHLCYHRLFRCSLALCLIVMMLLSMKLLPTLNESSAISPAYFINFIFDKYAPKRRYIIDRDWAMLCLTILRDGIFLLYLGAMLSFKKLNQTLKYTISIQLLTILIFYNPIVCAFVSTYFTGGVYMRTSDIVMSIFLVTSLLAYFANHPKFYKGIVSLACLAIVQLTAQTYQYLTHDFNQIDQRQNFNHLYRMNQDVIDTANFIESYVERYYENERPKVLTTQLALNYFSRNYEMIYTVNQERRVLDDSYRQHMPQLYLLRDGLKKSYELSGDQQQQFKKALTEEQPDLIIVPQVAAPWVHELFNEIAVKIDENASYLVYRLLI